MMPTDIQSLFDQIRGLLPPPFYKDVGFWVALVVGIAGLVFSILAFVEARRAKRAATEAGRTVRLQSITIELTEIAQKLDFLHPEITFDDARALLQGTSRRLRRMVSPFAKDSHLSGAISAALQALEGAQKSLKTVRPTDALSEKSAPNSVYYAIESDFSVLNDSIADLLGLFENETFDFGESNGNS
jgi:hypothetical protein